MSKEYHVKDKGDYYEVKEYDPFEYVDDTNTDPSALEVLGRKIRGLPRLVKTILTFLFDIYGILNRFTSNRMFGIIIALVQLSFIPTLLCKGLGLLFDFSDLSFPSIELFFRAHLNSISDFFVYFNYFSFLLYIIDIITILIKGDVILFAYKKRKDFKG